MPHRFGVCTRFAVVCLPCTLSGTWNVRSSVTGKRGKPPCASLSYASASLSDASAMPPPLQAMQCVLFPPDKGHKAAALRDNVPSHGDRANASLSTLLSSLLPHMLGVAPTAPSLSSTSLSHQVSREQPLVELSQGMLLWLIVSTSGRLVAYVLYPSTPVAAPHNSDVALRWPSPRPAPCSSGRRCLQEKAMDEDNRPGPITLDTGQPPGDGPGAAMTVSRPTAAPPRRAPANSRGWWPSWPLAPTLAGGQAPLSRCSTTRGACPHTSDGSTAAEAAAPPILCASATPKDCIEHAKAAPDIPSTPAGFHELPLSSASTAAAAPVATPGPASSSPDAPLSQDGSQDAGGWATSMPAGRQASPPCCPCRRFPRLSLSPACAAPVWGLNDRPSTPAAPLLARSQQHGSACRSALPNRRRRPWHHSTSPVPELC